MKLTDIAIKKAKPEAKLKKLYDGNGLILLIHPNGSKYWSFKYYHLGKEKSLSLGVYPEVSLAEARSQLIDMRKLVSTGKDPSEVRKFTKHQAIISAENNFEAIAREWYELRQHEWVTGYAEKMMLRMERHIFPKLGSRPIADINAPELLSVLKTVEQSGADLAQRMLQVCRQVFTYAIRTGRAKNNPAAEMRGALKTPVHNHHAYLKAADLPEYLQKLEAYDGIPQTKLALKFLLLTFVRTTELRAAEWQEIDFDKAEWRIPAERMKMKDLHIVPLARQSIAVLKELQNHSGNRVHIFPNSNRPITYMSENTMLYALYRMGYHSRTTGHGFRSTASTILNENGFRPDVIERQLAHAERNGVRRAYNHAEYLPERRKMMQWWGDYIDTITTKAANG